MNGSRRQASPHLRILPTSCPSCRTLYRVPMVYAVLSSLPTSSLDEPELPSLQYTASFDCDDDELYQIEYWFNIQGSLLNGDFVPLGSHASPLRVDIN